MIPRLRRVCCSGSMSSSVWREERRFVLRPLIEAFVIEPVRPSVVDAFRPAGLVGLEDLTGDFGRGSRSSFSAVSMMARKAVW